MVGAARSELATPQSPSKEGDADFSQIGRQARRKQTHGRSPHPVQSITRRGKMGQDGDRSKVHLRAISARDLPVLLTILSEIRPISVRHWHQLCWIESV